MDIWDRFQFINLNQDFSHLVVYDETLLLLKNYHSNKDYMRLEAILSYHI